MEIEEKIFENCKNILIHNYKISKENKIVIFYDKNTSLSELLLNGYSEVLSKLNFQFEYYDFYSLEVEKVLDITSKLNLNDLVILLQSSSFRVSSYRWRNLLHEMGLKVIEHAHMEKILITEYENYIDSLTYDLEHYLTANKFLRDKLSKSNSLKIISGEGKIVEFSGPFDEIIDNLGFFENKKNYGSRFPVGEILTESLDLSNLNGEIVVYAFPNMEQCLEIVEPFSCFIKDGIMISHKGPKKFDDLYKLIKTENEEGLVFVRELGLGLNRHIKKGRRIGDSLSYERIEGVHFSLGMKHGIFEKKLWPKYGKKFYQRFHIDVYLDVKEIFVNEEKIYDEKKGFLC